MTEPNPFTAAGVSAADALAGIAAGTPVLVALAKAAFTSVETTVQACTHPDGCANDATHQTQRPATDQEAAAHWDALEQNIRIHGNPDYIQNRDVTVTVAEHRCDDPGHADPAYLGATAAADAYAGAMHQLQHSVATFTAEQIAQLAASIRDIVGNA